MNFVFNIFDFILVIAIVNRGVKMKDKTSINRKSNTGAIERETKVHDKEGDIMAIASRDVISIPPSTSLYLNSSKVSASVLLVKKQNAASATTTDILIIFFILNPPCSKIKEKLSSKAF